MQRSLVYVGNPLLRKKAKTVEIFDHSLTQVVEDLKDTLLVSKKGVALAAPQIGVSLSIFMTRTLEDPQDIASATDQVRVYINPKITSISQQFVSMEEGCLSIPNLYRAVERPETVTFSAQDENGVYFTETALGWHARILLHENDHLQGSLFIDRLSKQEKKRIAQLLSKMERELNFFN